MREVALFVEDYALHRKVISEAGRSCMARNSNQFLIGT